MGINSSFACIRPAEIIIYTDGSCHTKLLVGAWASAMLINGEEVILQDVETGTTHNRMELKAVIASLQYLATAGLQYNTIRIITDSQYVVRLISRKEKLRSGNYITGKGTEVRNADLVELFIGLAEKYSPEFIKVKAHTAKGDTMNRKVDMLARGLVRKKIKEYGKQEP